MLQETPSAGIIVVFSTMPLLHQFSLVKKTGRSYHAFQGSDSWLRQPEDCWFYQQRGLTQDISKGGERGKGLETAN